jgi:haloacid dehalogenase-like hydrolase
MTSKQSKKIVNIPLASAFCAPTAWAQNTPEYNHKIPQKMRRLYYVFRVIFVIACFDFAHAQSDPLPSWNDTAPKQSIIAFVNKVTTDGTPDFVPVEDRIATFDNDGTLWVEQPMYVQLAFAFARVKQLAPQHPEWKTTQPFKGVLEGDMKAVAAAGEKGVMQLAMTTHTGMTIEQFQKIVSDWLDTATDPKFHKPYTECIYQPMVELLAYLRANGFKTYIVSGGGIEFMRPWVEKAYPSLPEFNQDILGNLTTIAAEIKPKC